MNSPLHLLPHALVIRSMDPVAPLSSALECIRIDSATQQGSVLDVIRAITGQPRQEPRIWMRFITSDDNREIADRCQILRINGKGKETPVAPAQTLVEIAWLLPGKARVLSRERQPRRSKQALLTSPAFQVAKRVRRDSSRAICQLLGGDLSLVDAIEARHTAMSGTPQQAFLLHQVVCRSVESSRRFRGLPLTISRFNRHPADSRTVSRPTLCQVHHHQVGMYLHPLPNLKVTPCLFCLRLRHQHRPWHGGSRLSLASMRQHRPNLWG